MHSLRLLHRAPPHPHIPTATQSTLSPLQTLLLALGRQRVCSSILFINTSPAAGGGWRGGDFSLEVLNAGFHLSDVLSVLALLPNPSTAYVFSPFLSSLPPSRACAFLRGQPCLFQACQPTLQSDVPLEPSFLSIGAGPRVPEPGSGLALLVPL